VARAPESGGGAAVVITDACAVAALLCAAMGVPPGFAASIRLVLCVCAVLLRCCDVRAAWGCGVAQVGGRHALCCAHHDVLCCCSLCCCAALLCCVVRRRSGGWL
jgi:hypothetical protein